MAEEKATTKRFTRWLVSKPVVRSLIEDFFVVLWLFFVTADLGWRGAIATFVGMAVGYVVLARPEFERMTATAEEAQRIAEKYGRFISENADKFVPLKPKQ